MNYSDLRAFVVLSQTLHLGNASQLLHMSPSSLSRRLSKMEASIGARLVERGHSTVRLTDMGQAFLQHAEQTLEDFNLLKQQSAPLVDLRQGELTLFCSVTAIYSLLADLTSRFSQRYPNVHLRIHTGDVAEAMAHIESGAADVAVAARPDVLPETLAFKSMRISPLVLIAPKHHRFDVDDSRTTQAWMNQPLILSERGLARERLDRWLDQQEIKPTIYAEVAGNEAIVSMVALGLGVGVVPSLVLSNSPVASQVREITMSPELEPFSIGLCAQTERLSEPSIQALWKTAGGS